MIITFLLLYIISNTSIYKKLNINNYDIKTSSIIKENVNVFYPYFKNNTTLNKYIREYIYNYIKTNKTNINIDYYIYNNYNYSNIVFIINKTKYYNILYNDSTILSITDIYDIHILESMIKESVKNKYSNSIYMEVSKININDNTYIIDDKYLIVYFNSTFESLGYIPYIKINQSKLL